MRTISGQFKKSDLCVEHRLNVRRRALPSPRPHSHTPCQPRDLRKIDSRIPNLVPTILARRAAILVSPRVLPRRIHPPPQVNVLHIRALIKADAVILFDTYGSPDSRLQSIFLYHLEHNLKAKGGLPYEFRALESVLVSVLSALEAEMVFLRNLIGGLLAELEDDIDRDKFKRLLHYSRRLAAFQNRAKLVRLRIPCDPAHRACRSRRPSRKSSSRVRLPVCVRVCALSPLADEDLAAMYLSDKLAGKPRPLHDHEDLEVLLESFSKQVEEIVNEAEAISVSTPARAPPPADPAPRATSSRRRRSSSSSSTPTATSCSPSTSRSRSAPWASAPAPSSPACSG